MISVTALATGPPIKKIRFERISNEKEGGKKLVSSRILSSFDVPAGEMKS